MTEYLELFCRRRQLSNETLRELRSGEVSYARVPFVETEEFLDALNKYKDLEITIYPDYDADGIMAGVILYASLSVFGFKNVNIISPTIHTGYGLSRESAERLLALYPNTRVVVTCDNGISANDGIMFLKERGIPTLVSDHHYGKLRPPAEVVCDPNAKWDKYPFKTISGATVIWYLMRAYAAKYAKDKEELIGNLLVFAGISAITDSMSVMGENRSLIRNAVDVIKYMVSLDTFDAKQNFPSAPSEYLRAFDGLYALLKAIKENGKIYSLDETFFGFSLGPLLNCPRRCEGDSKKGFDLFVGDMDVDEAAKILVDLNEERKNVVAFLFAGVAGHILDEDIENPKTKCPYNTCSFISNSEGYMGLIAGKMQEMTGLPALCCGVSSDIVEVLQNDAIYNPPYDQETVYSGSMRAPFWFDLVDFTDWFISQYPNSMTFGGHKQAGGITIKRDYLEVFTRTLLDESVQKRDYLIANGVSFESFDISFGFGNDDSDFDIKKTKEKDLFEFYDELCELKPFGNGFRSPGFRLEIDRSDDDVRTQQIGSNHLKFVYKDFEFIIWNSWENFLNDGMPEHLTFTGELDVNEFRDLKKISFKGNSYSLG